MRQFLAVMLCLCILFQGTILAMAAEPKAVPLKQGETAPFDGVLISPGRVQELLAAEIERDELKTKLDLCERMRDIETTEYQRALKVKWYQRPGFNQGVGFFIGAIFMVFSVWGAGQLDDHH